MLFFCLYAALLIALGLLEARRARDASSFFVNGRRSGPWHTGFSLIGAAVGGSATVGVAGLAWQVGTPAFWWMGSLALGFACMALLLARSVNESGAWTMPELIEAWLGRPARTLAACIIVPGWVLILAAQFIALGKLAAMLTGLSPQAALAAASSVLVFYSALGGQASVIRSDLPQGLILLGGLLMGIFCLFLRDPAPLLALDLSLVNESFGSERVFSFLLVMGGSCLAGPTMYSVLLSARDAPSARRGAWLAALALVLASLLVAGFGVLCRGLVPASTLPDDVLPSAIALMPDWAGMAMLAALFSAMLSSADSCLVTASAVLCNDLLRRRSAALCRSSALVLGLLAWMFAAQGFGILGLMLAACNACMCGLLGPVLASRLLSVLNLPPASRSPRLCAAAVASGGMLGLSTSLLASSAALALSFSLTFAAGVMMRKD
ncbi:sodium:solute symporter family protein [Mailhella sp.]